MKKTFLILTALITSFTLVSQSDSTSIEIEEEDTSSMQFSFPPAPSSGKVAVEAHEVRKAFGDNQVLDGVNYFIERGKKVAFVGKNGEGKTTMIRALVGELEHEGELKIGHNVEMAYFAQNQAEYLEGEKTVLQTMEDASNDGNRVKVRDKYFIICLTYKRRRLRRRGPLAYQIVVDAA